MLAFNLGAEDFLFDQPVLFLKWPVSVKKGIYFTVYYNSIEYSIIVNLGCLLALDGAWFSASAMPLWELFNVV